MFKIYDSRDYFYQWDLDRKLIVYDETIKEVHFCNRADDCSLVCEVYKEGELNIVNVPNVLLQDNWRINVYAYDNNYTKYSTRFDVKSRSKPADYVYTETEIKSWDDLDGRIAALEKGGAGASGGSNSYILKIHCSDETGENVYTLTDGNYAGVVAAIEAGETIICREFHDDGCSNEYTLAQYYKEDGYIVFNCIAEAGYMYSLKLDTENDIYIFYEAIGGNDYKLPIATSTRLGGVKPVAKADDMTQPVGIDAAGALWTAAGGASGGAVVDTETFETLIDFTTEESVAEFQVPIGTNEIVAKIQKATDIYLLISIPRDAEGDTTTESVGNITLSLYTTWKQSLFSDVSIITAPSHTWSWGGKMLCHFTNVPLCDSRGIAQTPTLQECFYFRDSVTNSSKSVHTGGNNNIWHSYFGANSYFIVTGTQNMYKGTRFILGVAK